jgi:hypothetical protein
MYLFRAEDRVTLYGSTIRSGKTKRRKVTSRL